MEPARRGGADPLWLTHHPPTQYDRCVLVGERHVCRRCLVLYPLALASAVAVVALGAPRGLLVAILWLLPLPAVVDWVAEHVGVAEHSPSRQVLVTAVAAPALGTAFAMHAVEPFDLAAVAAVLCWTTIAIAAWWIGLRGGTDHDAWRRAHAADEARRARRLTELLERTDDDAERARSD